MTAKLISTTNHGMSHYAGRPGTLEIGIVAIWSGESSEDTFHTSALRSYELEGNTLKLQTLNSTYAFEILEGTFDPSLIISPPQWLIEDQERKNSTPYAVYWCQITAPGMLDHAMSVVRLPHPMKRQEAIDYVAFNVVTDVTGHIVYSILSPYTGESQ